MTDLFLLAAQRKLRFASRVGALTVEQLFDLPLTSARGASLDNVAQQIAQELRAVAEESFVALSTNPRKGELELQLEIAKAVILIKQTEASNAKARADKAAQRQTLREAIDAAKNRELATKDVAALEQMLADLDA